MTPSPTPAPAPAYSISVYTSNGQPFDPLNEFAPAIGLFANNGVVTSAGSHVHVHGLPSGATATDYKLVVDSWVVTATNGAMDASHTFSASGDFAGDYTSTVGGDPFAANAWVTGGNFKPNGLTTLSGLMNAGGGMSADVSGTAMLRLLDINDVELASLSITWEYRSTWS